MIDVASTESRPEPEPAVRLLGRTALLRDGEYRDAGTPKQAGVLAALAWNVGSPVPLPTLLDRLWGDRLPDTARRTYAGYVARLRKPVAECGGRVEWTGEGYLLDLAPELVDLHRMRALTARARTTAETDPEAASVLRRQALQLWRGLPLTGAWGEWAARVRGGLERELHGLRCEHLAAELAVGRHATALPELIELSQLNPLDQNVAALHMLALHEGGQTDVALRRYRSLRKRLREELGVEPSARVMDTHRRILRDDPGLRSGSAPTARPTPTVLPRQLPAAPFPFVGRTAELERLDTLAGPDSQLPLVGITGPGGIGKTTLGLRWAHDRADRFPDGQLYVDLRGFSAEKRLTPDQALSGFLRALGTAEDRIPAETADKSALYRSLVAGKRILVFCDNAADTAQVEPLLPGSPTAVTVATSRNDLSAARIAHGMRSVRLAGLERPDSRRLLELAADLTERPDPDQADAIARLCGDFPLAIRLAAASAHVYRGELERLSAALTDNRLSTLCTSDGSNLAMRGCFDLSYHHLGPGDRAVLHALGLHPGPECQVEPLAAQLDATVADTEATLGRLAALNLVSRSPGQRWRVHDLVHDYARERARQQLPGDEVHRRLTRMYDWYLAATVQAGDTAFGSPPWWDPPVPDVALPDPPDRDAATAWLDRNHPALIASTHDAAADHPYHCAHLPSALAKYLSVRLKYDTLLAVSKLAVAASRRLGRPRLEAGHELGFAVAYDALGRIAEEKDALLRALRLSESIDDANGIAVARGNLELLKSRGGDCDEASAHFIRYARYFGDRGHHLHQALSHDYVAANEYQRGRLDLALEHQRRAIDIRLEHGVRFEQATAYGYLGLYRLRGGDLDEARTWLERAARPGETIDRPLARRVYLSRMGLLHTRLREHDAAVRFHNDAFAELDEAADRYGTAEVYNNAGESHAAAGNQVLALECHREALSTATAVNRAHYQAVAHHGIALALRAMGRPDPEDHRAAAVAIYRRMGAPVPAELAR